MGLQRLLGLQSLATSPTSPSSCLGPEAHSFLWPPHETPEPQSQQVYCWR